MAKKKINLKTSPKSIDPTDVGGPILAKVLGLSSSHVSKLFSKRVINQNGKRGKYNLYKAAPQYVESIRTSGTAEAGERLKVQQERKLRLANDEAERNLVKIDEAAELFQVVCAELKNAISAIPRRAATQINQTTSAAACRKVLETEYAEALEAFEKPLREYYGVSWDSLTKRK